jgi:hypothetical protein
MYELLHTSRVASASETSATPLTIVAGHANSNGAEG